MEFNKNKLEDVAANSLYTTFTNSTTIEYSYRVFKRYIKAGTVLELGAAEGLMTSKLLEVDPNLYIVEGSRLFSEQLKQKFPSVTVINKLFEEVTLDVKFDNIILGHVLEHVEDPVKILKIATKWLKEDGLLFTAVPNARSIHRQAAVEMGLINSIFDLSEKDIHHGHMRIYTPETFTSDFIKAGLEVYHKGGYWLKPISDSQIQDSWSKEMLDAFMKMGEYYPDIAAELYIIANKK